MKWLLYSTVDKQKAENDVDLADSRNESLYILDFAKLRHEIISHRL